MDKLLELLLDYQKNHRGGNYYIIYADGSGKHCTCRILNSEFL